ncbi:iron ABC transporter permease [Kangiella sp. HZ709]|uniref:FecCD family ABC transporter permease n=1 Tax=Kangiella sp. HZ709 TaxID=2666328 RepID=UPI0012AF6BC7|nr:iron ABC transporter permease [Kangiella sp. HZ709]MRX27584.1 iron chelate uptake ABC transporter family permease subunit [Kangiella sp. HZ709]
MNSSVFQKQGHRYWLLGLLLTVVWCAISVGAAKVDFAFPFELIANWFGLNNSENYLVTIVNNIRLPRVVLAILVGAILAISGASLQGLCRNPLADPGLLGISSGAAVGAVTVIVMADKLAISSVMQPYLTPLAAITGAAVATFVIYRLAQVKGNMQIATLLLAGVAVNALGGALIGVFSYIADDQALRMITFWMMGSLASASWKMLAIISPVLIVCIVLMLRKKNELNLLLLGEANARYVGVEVDKVKRELLWLNAIGVGVAVSVTGAIGFIGLVIPHILRLGSSADYRFLLLNSALLGAALLILADVIARTMISPAELPIGLVTAVLGAPFFIALLIKQKKKLVLGI